MGTQMFGLLTEIHMLTFGVFSPSSERAHDEGLMLKTSALQSLYGGQFTLSCQFS